MKVTHLFLSAAFGSVLLAGCQPPATTTEEPPVAETPADTTPVAEVPVALPCGVIAQRNWEGQLGSGGTPTLTVSGEIDLGTPGYGVSLIRDAAEASGATTALLTLALRPPSGMQAQVVTATPVRYFGPARGAYTAVQITCDGAPLTTIPIAP